MTNFKTIQRIIFTGLLLLPALLFAQTFRFTEYTTHNGLPIDNVYAAAQDTNGFIWFATDFGISKYDGYRFKNYDRRNGMIGKTVTDIVYAGGDSMIFLSYPLAIQSIHSDGRINTITEYTGITLQQLTRHGNEFYYYNRNENYFGLLKNGVAKYMNADSFFNAKGVIVNAIVSLGNRGVGFCTDNGFIVKNNDQFKTFLAGRKVDFIIANPDGSLTGTADSHVIASDAQFNFHDLPFVFPDKFMALHMIQEADGSTWFRGQDKGIYRLQNNRLEEMSYKLGLQNKVVNEFFTDAESNTWFCTDGSGIIFKKRSGFTNFETQDGLVNNKVLKSLAVKDGLLIGTSNGICIKKAESITAVNLPVADVGLKYVQKLLPVYNADAGICIQNSFSYGDDTSSIYSFVKYVNAAGCRLKAYRGNFAWEKNADDIWLSFANSLMHWVDNKNAETIKFLDIDSSRKIYCMGEYNGKLWLGSNKGLFYYQQNKFVKQQFTGSDNSGEVFQFLADKRNRFWIATETGLFVLENNQYKKIPEGTSMGSNYCKGIAQDDKGNIWCATWDGIFETDGITRTNYNTTEGLNSKTANCILFDSSNRNLYVGTDNGLNVINIDSLRTPVQFAQVYITCSLGDSFILKEGVYLKPSQNNLSFYLNTPYYRGGSAIIYEYKLDNGPWMVAANPTLLISGIESGNHKFYARAKINNIVFTRQDAVFSFTIQTPFYKSWWFILVLLILSQAIIIYVINRIIKKSKERKLAFQTQQAEYASLKQQAFTSLMNPHFIFNALNSVQHYINKQDRQNANKYLSDFASLVRRSFDSAQRSFVSLDEELETVRLYLQLEKMRFADKFNYSITLSKEVEDDEWMLPSMVLQPFLENAILHGLIPLNSSGQLNIEATIINNALCVTITDNGIGIKKSKALRAGKAHKSRGMQLIKERLELLSKLGTESIELTIIELNSGAANPGTKIILLVPQSVYEAFAKQPGRG
ncbi:MAG: histidine kinase [Ferruginibacter sp.]